MIHANSRRIEIRHILLPCRSIVTHSQYSRFQRILYQHYSEACDMQRRKILVACLSLLLVGLALPTTNINRAHAFTSGNNSVTLSNILANFVFPPSTSTFGGVTVAQAGTPLSVAVVVQASTFNTQAYIRNVTIGFKGDWMLSYTNASIIPLTAGQIGSATISIPLPSAGSVNTSHSWRVEVWDGPASGLVS